MTFTGDCFLCQSKNVEIRKSHIVPELCYKHVYTSKHKFFPMNINRDYNLKLEQKGYRERLLCQKCETKFSRWEGEFGNFLNHIITPGTNRLTLNTFANCILINNFNYNYIKKALISIFWRMSISHLDLFSAYDLGPYNEKFRNFLNSDVHIPSANFPILISKATLKGEFHSGILMPINKGRYSGKIIMQSMVLNGFVFDILISENKKIPEEVSLFCIKDKNNGTAVMVTREFADLDLPLEKLKDIAKSSETREFFKKHDQKS